MLLFDFNFDFLLMYTQVMLIFILIDVQYLQKVVFSLEKGSIGQNHSFSGSHHSIKNPLTKFPIPPPLNAIWKTLHLLARLDFYGK